MRAKNSVPVDLQVQEVPGYYGLVKMEERVAQRIWQEQNFFTDSLLTECGQKIDVIDCGKWNLAEEGPDFNEASLLIDGIKHQGDVEVHFYPNQWKLHRHHLDSNFDKVILQVTIFAGHDKPSSVTRMNGKPVPSLVLLPHLYYGLEEYAEHHALANLSGNESDRDNAHKELTHLRFEKIEDLALSRWLLKTKYALHRLSDQEWSDACHQWFLEILGYKRNRSNMVKISQQYPLSCWTEEKIDPVQIFGRQDGWRLRGCRPANHPRVRLHQYADLCASNPNWVNDLASLSGVIQEVMECNPGDRKPMLELAKRWKNSVLLGKFSDGKANTLWIDGMMPLLCARYNLDAFQIWKNWPVGDFPQSWKMVMKQAGWLDRSKRRVFCNGMVQGIIQFRIESHDAE